MRVMVLVKADKDSEAGVMPDTKSLAEMGNFNEELVKAGILLAADGLHASAKGKRVIFRGDKRTVVDGPFGDPNSLVAGFWIWRVASMNEAVDWAKRCPNPTGVQWEVEIRPIFEPEDFADALTPELRAQEAKLRAKMEKEHES